MAKKDFEKNVIVTVFKVESEGYQALTELRQAAAGDAYLVSAAALVKRESGSCVLLDGFDTGVQTSNDTVVGGLVGMLIGALAGPIGMLLGAGYGALVGMSADAGDAVFGASMLEQIVEKLEDGMVALVALTGELDPAVLDDKFTAYDCVIARFDAEAIADEVDEAYMMQEEMARQTRMQLRKDRKEKRAAKFEADVDKAAEKAAEQAGAAAERFNEAAEKAAEAVDASREKKEEAREKLQENEEIFRHGFTK